MISVIICSRNSIISSSLNENIGATIGVQYEIITIDNSSNNYSIQLAYNLGLSKSIYPYICFVHEDVLFKTLNWGQQLIDHLNTPRCGIVGVAGGKIITNVPAQWSNEKSYINIIQHKKGLATPVYLNEPYNSSSLRESAIVVDGVFLSMHKDIFSKIKFDEKLGGFHGYDYDISIQATVAGYTNFVAYDILLEHFSAGNKDFTYYKSLINVFKKWSEFLPLFTNDVSINSAKNIQQIEQKRLNKLIRRMAKLDFSTNEILSNMTFFIGILKEKEISIKISGVRLRIFCVRFYSHIRNWLANW